jgi:hypothetical protein
MVKIKVQDIVEDILMSIEDDDFLSNTSESLVYRYARRGLRDISQDVGARIKSAKFDVDSGTQTIDLSSISGLVDIAKIGVVGSDGMVYVLANNKNINFSSASATDATVDKTATSTPGGSSDSDFDQFIFHNYFANGTYGQLYGLGGGQRYGDYRVNRESERIEFSSNNNLKEVVIEYLFDPASEADPEVAPQLEEALRSYIYYRLIERKASVPISEKQRARKEYYNELRKGRARMSEFSKEDALQVIKKNFKLSPKL